eukprot:2792323-Heterocapsa_arctica.AAC.1
MHHGEKINGASGPAENLAYCWDSTLFKVTAFLRACCVDAQQTAGIEAIHNRYLDASRDTELSLTEETKLAHNPFNLNLRVSEVRAAPLPLMRPEEALDEETLPLAAEGSPLEPSLAFLIPLPLSAEERLVGWRHARPHGRPRTNPEWGGRSPSPTDSLPSFAGPATPAAVIGEGDVSSDEDQPQFTPVVEQQQEDEDAGSEDLRDWQDDESVAEEQGEFIVRDPSLGDPRWSGHRKYVRCPAQARSANQKRWGMVHHRRVG